MPLTGNVLKPLAKSILIPLGLAAAPTNAAIHKKKFRFGNATLIIFHEEMNDNMKIVDSLEESGLLLKVVNQTIEHEAKEQERGCMGMLLGTLGASLLGNPLTGKGTIRAVESTIRAGQDF